MFPLVPSPLGGNLGAFTVSVFRLDPTGVAVLEPVADVVPGLSPLRVTFDMADSESAIFEYDVTEHAIQGLIDISSNVRRKLRGITITGTLGALPPLLPGVGGFQPPSPGGLLRLDLMRMRNLVAIADARAMVMVVTPRVALARCFITSINQNWSPDNGESTMVTMTVREARLVSLMLGDVAAADHPAQLPGNNTSTGGGQSSVRPIEDLTVEPSGVTGVPSTLVPA